MNASGNSATHLQEAGVFSTAPAFVAEARAFVESEMGEELTAEYASPLQKLWKPPAFVAGGGKRRSAKARLTPAHQPLWVVPLDVGAWDSDHRREALRARPAAAKRIRPRDEKLDEFSYAGRFCDHVNVRDLVLQVVHVGRKTYVLRAGHVVGLRRFRGGRGRRCVIVFLAAHRHSRRKSLVAVRKALSAPYRRFLTGDDAHRVRPGDAVHAILQLWTPTAAR